MLAAVEGQQQNMGQYFKSVHGDTWHVPPGTRSCPPRTAAWEAGAMPDLEGLRKSEASISTSMTWEPGLTAGSFDPCWECASLLEGLVVQGVEISIAELRARCMGSWSEEGPSIKKKSIYLCCYEPDAMLKACGTCICGGQCRRYWGYCSRQNTGGLRASSEL